MKKYQLTNNIVGWMVFAVSAIVLLLTIEPTASFWDCPEFITAAYKLEVGHPPGAPFFMLVGNFFTQFASDSAQVAKMVNAMSALCGAFTILFLFWTITHLARKIVLKNEKDEPSIAQTIILMGCGVVGALACAFSDTFWYSAVESEVYAFSSLFTALVFWLILKWENVAEQPHSDRWIILIAYLMGLSIGVHLLNLLAIPALVLVYYFKKYPNANAKGALKALLVSFALILVLMYGLIPGFFAVAGQFELFFVNTLGMPFNTGLVIYCILIVALLIWGLYETLKEKINMTRVKVSFASAVILMGLPLLGGLVLGIILSIALIIFLYTKKNLSIRVLNTSLLCLLVILIGYSSYAVIVIRSSANPPMDQNSPEDVFSLASYMSREQYGERPLFYGQTFASDRKFDKEGKSVVKKGRAKWIRKEKENKNEKDKYIISGYKESPEYENNMLLTRMYSMDSNHIGAYKYWGGIKDKIVGGKAVSSPTPSFIHNIRYLFSYQLNFMYWRYFMWNFSGRQNDIQGHGEITNGNWITGINFIDNYILGLGDQNTLPTSMKANKGRNVYFMLPLLLGLIGLFYQAFSGKKGVEGFWITFFLFFMTGIAIVFYLNQTPYQPRERDYAYAGSFYAFCIWIGLGVAGLARILDTVFPKMKTISATVATLIALIVPIQMISQNWDDHDRSNRYTTRDFGRNYLDCCEPNAIIFTNGDNDTFPLWYAQEVDGYRTDVRVCNLSYLNTDWYIDQMKRYSYESEPLPIRWNRIDYVEGKHDGALLFDQFEGKAVDLDWALKNFVLSNNPEIEKMRKFYMGYDVFLAKRFILKVDSSEVEKAGLMPKDSVFKFSPDVLIDLSNKTMITKSDMMVLEMLIANKWERPMYYATTVGHDMYMGLSTNFLSEGLVYRIMPYQANGAINTDTMYENMVNKFQFGNVKDPNVYLDENILRMSKTLRIMFVRLSSKLLEEGKNEKALKAIDKCMEELPAETVGLDTPLVFFAESYYKFGRKDEAKKILEAVGNDYMEQLIWYNSLSDGKFVSIMSDVKQCLQGLQAIMEVYRSNNENDLSKKYEDALQLHFHRWAQFQQME